MNLCIPTLNRYDRLYNCIKSALDGSLVPEMFYIVDNGCQLPESIRDLAGKRLFLYTPWTNIGVSASWNYFLETVKHPMLICNDDLEFSHRDIEAFDGYYKNSEGDFFYTNNIEHLNMFSCFMPTKRLIDRIGYFDESFSPAYFEDNDYFRRMKLDEDVLLVPVETNIKHYASSTIEKFSIEQMQKHHDGFRANEQYYISKWGGLPHKEKYTTPFGA
jgi:hypothetical protein